MRKKLTSILLCMVMALSCVSFSACGSAADDFVITGSTKLNSDGSSGDSDDASAEVAVDAEDPTFQETFGDPNGTHIELWTFIDAHAAFYGKMAEEWNAANPDRTIELTATSYPYDTNHHKLLQSFQDGSGGPDICDVELGQYPNVVTGQDEWLYPLDDAMKDYAKVMVQARLDTYAGADGKHYGAPFHVGATVMYYNLDTLQKYGITQKDVDAVVTWDDFEALGKRYVEARKEDGKYFTQVDITGTDDWTWLAMAEYGDDWTGGFNGKPNVELDSVKKMLKNQQRWLDEGVAEVSPDGNIDLDAGYQNIMEDNVVAFPKAMWYMSRFMNYMSKSSGAASPQDGKWYIAKCPVFEKGQKCSVGMGGTGTVVTQQSKNKELAAEWLCYAKMSPDGEKHIWEELGFDVCNSSLWTDAAFADNENNPYNTFFVNKPYDVLADIGLDNIGMISVVKISPVIRERMQGITQKEILLENRDVDEALADAQAAIELEAE